MAPSNEAIARELAVSFYTDQLRGEPVSHALFHARIGAMKPDNSTALLFGMAGYADARIVERPAATTQRPVPKKKRAASRTK